MRPLWEIHRHIGMGGDRLVAELAGNDVEREAGDASREAEGRLYAEMIDEVEALPDARDALIALGAGGRSRRGAPLACRARRDHRRSTTRCGGG